jgi:hypothetical protein
MGQIVWQEKSTDYSTILIWVKSLKSAGFLYNAVEAPVHPFLCLYLSISNTRVLSYTLSWRWKASVTQIRELMGGGWRSECARNERQPMYFKHTMETAIREESCWQPFLEASYIHTFRFLEVRNCYCFMLTVETCCCESRNEPSAFIKKKT